MKKKILSVLMIFSFAAAALTGCRNNAFVGGGDDYGEIDGGNTGADWRTWGIIDAYGTIVADGNSTDVCVCLYSNRAELYYDEPSQSLFMTIEYPETLTSEQYENVTIAFDDLDGDGNSDITIGSTDSSGAEYKFCYVYDMEEYVYIEALSNSPANSGDASDEVEEYDDVVYEGEGLEFEGVYSEAPSGRCTISITSKGEGTYRVIIAWSNNASSLECWEIENAQLTNGGYELEYSDAVYYITTYNSEDESYSREDIYSDGTGRYFFNEDGQLGWISDNSALDGVNGDVFFVRTDIVSGGEG